MSQQLNLSTVEVDFAALRLQLQNALASKDAWKGILPTQTGQTLIDFGASVGAFSLAKSLRYAQDNFSETAIASRAIYAIHEMQGVRLSRKLGALITATATYSPPLSSSPPILSVPAFTQFLSSGTYWYNVEPFSVPIGGSVTALFRQGYVVDITLAGLGTDYQTFVSKERDFTVEDATVQVFINGVSLTKSYQGLWTQRGVQAFQDKTTPEGHLRIVFGNTVYGAKPQPTDLIRILYAVTSGLDGNNVTTYNQRITSAVDGFEGLTLIGLTNPEGGGDQTDAQSLKGSSSTNFGNFGSAVGKPQYIATALEYPGVLDVKTYAQREIDPTDLRLMNTIKVVPLTATPFGPAEKAAFLKYVEDASMYSPRLYWDDPVAVPRDISLCVYCYNFANLRACENSAKAAVQELFRKRKGTLGYDITVSDLNTAVMASNKGIEYVDFYAPSDDLNVSGRPIELPTVTVNSPVSPSALVAGSYTYGIAVQLGSLGVALPTKFVDVGVLSGKTVTLSWYPYGQATGYVIYGRTSNALKTMATLSSTTLSWTDNGTITPSTPIPTTNSFPAAYNELGVLNVVSAFSKRRR